MVVVDDGCDSPDDNGDDDNADDDVKLKTNLILKKIYITFLNSEPWIYSCCGHKVGFIIIIISIIIKLSRENSYFGWL